MPWQYDRFALLATFIFSWIFWGKITSRPAGWTKLKTKIIYTIIMIPVLGFLPQISGYGYYGMEPLQYYIAPSTITSYREVHYAPSTPVVTGPTALKPETRFEEIMSKIFPKLRKRSSDIDVGTGSSIVVGTGLDKPSNFIVKSFKSFTYVLLGPLPWQIRYHNQLVALLETLPWYFLLFFIIKGAFQVLKRKRAALPILIFSLLSIFVLSLFINNLGIASRIRIPSFIALLCLIPIGMIKNKIKK